MYNIIYLALSQRKYALKLLSYCSPISESRNFKVILKLVAFKFKLALSQRKYALKLLRYCSPISESWNFKVILKLVAFKFKLAF